MMASAFRCLCAFGLACAFPAWSLAELDAPLGGVPTLERMDILEDDADGFAVSIYTAIYSGPNAVLPDAPELAELGEEDSYFCYLVENVGSDSLDLFGILNPDFLGVWAVGYLTSEVEGLDLSNRVTPSVYYGGTDLISYMWTPDEGLLAPGQWAVLFFGVTGGWKDVVSFAGGDGGGGLKFAELLGPSADAGEVLPPCEGDVNCDGIVDPLDVGAVVSRFGLDVEEAGAAYDPNGDGVIDALDIGFILSRFGTCN